MFEGSFLAQCFLVSYALPTTWSASRARPAAAVQPLLLTPPDVYFLQRPDRLYGAAYGENVFARLWQEYAKADRRWGGVDLGVVSLEMLTVGVGAPLAGYVCFLLTKGEGRGGLKKWWWMTVLAVGELYGGEFAFPLLVGHGLETYVWEGIWADILLILACTGWMTFAPEWLCGSPNLDTSNWMYLCVSPFLRLPLTPPIPCRRHSTLMLTSALR